MGVLSMTTMTNELYANVYPDVQQQLTEHERPATVPKGSKLLRHGVPSEELIIVNSGSAEVTVPVRGKNISLGVVGSGKVLGLRSVICGEVPEVDVTCLEPCDITFLPRDAFLEVLRRNPQMYFAVVKVLSADLKKAHIILRQKTGQLRNRDERPRT
jgi:CRP/FNR family transcriptional regulator